MNFLFREKIPLDKYSNFIYIYIYLTLSIIFEIIFKIPLEISLDRKTITYRCAEYRSIYKA